MLMKVILILWAVMCVLTFALFGIDKKRAKKGEWRIKEATLLGCSFIGGAIGGLIGMQVFHHKTKKPRFAIGVPLMAVLHVVLAAVFLFK